jgi:tetratricopeptide (TPR) repeat protein
VGGTGLALNDISNANISVPKNSFWAGEVIPITYTLSVVKRYFHSLASTVEWPAAPLVAEEWTKPEPSEIMVRGERRLVATQTTQAYVKQPGNFTLKPATQMVNLVVGQTGFGLFSSPTVEQRVLTTDPLEINVQPLPPTPTGFSGVVGQFSLVSKIVPTTPAVGEPVTWTLELAGTGNWPDIAGLPQREASNDFQVVQPKSKRTMKDNSLFEGKLSEDVVLVPSKPGQYTLGPVKFIYFDTAAGEYKTITTDPVTVTVAAAASQPQPAAPTGPVQFSLGPTSGQTGSVPVPAAPTAKPPVPPENLPRDPLAEGRSGILPFGLQAMFVLCALGAVLVPALAWLVFAAMHSRLTDPQRLRREALAQLSATLAKLRGPAASREARDAGLRSWQQLGAVLWKIPHAAPGSRLIHAGVVDQSESAATTWAKLWDEADRALHSQSGELPSDWASRAESALRLAKVPGWSVFSLFHRRNLLPFLGRIERPNTQGLNQVIGAAAPVVFVLGLFIFLPSALGSDNGVEAYKRGDFPAAETAWRTELTAAPDNWSARHNLGLALAQQDRWPEATSEWAGAYLLAPRATETQWDLALGLQKSGLAPDEFVEFSRGHGRFAIARLASPGEWQLALVGASLCIAGALIVLLLKGYGRIGGWARPVALTVILLAILLAAAATLSLRTYGPLAHPDVALVWRPGILRSIPTEADTAQKTTTLSAGSVAIVNKTFFGWSRLAFAGGQTGWVRSEDLIRLYR